MAASTQMTRTLGSGAATTIFTLSMWFKRSGLASSTSYQTLFRANGSGDSYLSFQADDTLDWSGDSSSAVSAGFINTNRVFRDPEAWMHVVVRFDSSEVSANDRLRLYINGVDERSVGGYSVDTMPNSSVDDNVNLSGNVHRLGASTTSQYFEGSMSHCHLCIGYSYAPTEFGEFDSVSGIWKLKADPSVSYGTNGWFLKMEDRTNLDLDSSPNANTFTTVGTPTPTYDSPSNNFITLNPLGENVIYTSGSHDLLNGNTTFDPTNASNESWSASTLGVSASKWYWEVKFSGTPGGDWPDIGLIQTDDISTRQADSTPSQHGETYMSAYEPNGTKWIFGSQTTSWGSGYVSGDIIMCALDCDNGKLWWGKNGTWEASGSVGDPANGTNPAGTFTAGTLISPYVATFDAGSVYLYHNFGNGYFGTTAVSSAQADDAGIGAMEYDVPAGYYCLCTKNIKAYGG